MDSYCRHQSQKNACLAYPASCVIIVSKCIFSSKADNDIKGQNKKASQKVSNGQVEHEHYRRLFVEVFFDDDYY